MMNSKVCNDSAINLSTIENCRKEGDEVQFTSSSRKAYLYCAKLKRYFCEIINGAFAVSVEIGSRAKDLTLDLLNDKLPFSEFQHKISNLTGQNHLDSEIESLITYLPALRDEILLLSPSQSARYSSSEVCDSGSVRSQEYNHSSIATSTHQYPSIAKYSCSYPSGFHRPPPPPHQIHPYFSYNQIEYDNGQPTFGREIHRPAYHHDEESLKMRYQHEPLSPYKASQFETPPIFHNPQNFMRVKHGDFQQIRDSIKNECERSLKRIKAEVKHLEEHILRCLDQIDVFNNFQ